MPPSRRSYVALMGLLLLACGDDPAGPGDDGIDSGSLSFQYSGDRTGGFQAVGKVPAAGGSLHGTWSAAVLLDDTALVLIGARARTAPRVDLFALRVSGATSAGSYSFSAISGGGLGGLFFDVDPEQLDTDPQATRYGLTAGTVIVDEIQGGRVRGTLSVDGVLLETGTDRIFLREGSFDLPLVEEEPVPAPTLAVPR